MNKDLGQLIICGVSGLSLTEVEKKIISEENIGGIILFKENYSNPAQLAELVNEIQSLRNEYPLFISVDQEGGRVRRFKSHFTQFPSMYEIAKKNSPKLTFDVHKAIADELSICGINLNFSPCCDIFSNPKNSVIGDRSFGKTSKIVEKHISAAIRGLHTGGVLACAKHFPGHGDTLKDSHYDLPYVGLSLAELEQREIQPFIKAAKSRVEFIMMAHLVVDAIDNKLPCTLSKNAYEYLRKVLKYSKLIITDDMEMQAIKDNFEVVDAAVMAINAGADLLIYRSMEQAQIALNGLSESYKKKELKKILIDEKLDRINACKEKYLKEYSPIYIPNIEKKISDQNNHLLLES